MTTYVNIDMKGKKIIIAKCSLKRQYLCTIVNGRIPDKPLDSQYSLCNIVCVHIHVH